LSGGTGHDDRCLFCIRDLLRSPSTASLQQEVESKAAARRQVKEDRSLEVGPGPALDEQPQSVKAQRIEEGAQHEQCSREAIDLGTSHWAWGFFPFLFIYRGGWRKTRPLAGSI